MKELKLDAKIVEIELSATGFEIRANIYTKDEMMIDPEETYDLIRIGSFNQKILIHNAHIAMTGSPELSHWTVYIQKVTIKGQSFSVHWKPSLSVRQHV